MDREDSKTLVDITVNLFYENASVMTLPEDETNEVVKEIYSNLASTMTDRTATMKTFGRQLAEKKNEILETDTGLEFLFCNAHFLLGLSSAAEKTFVAFEDQIGWRKQLGRDKIAAFFRFKNSAKDAAACRLIRLACDIFGPCGDEKSGCGDEWLAYCTAQDKPSVFQSFRSKQCNNFFKGAAAVIHNKDMIIDFLTNFHQDPNLKQRSVLKDTESGEIMIMVTALAVVYVCVFTTLTCRSASRRWNVTYEKQVAPLGPFH